MTNQFPGSLSLEMQRLSDLAGLDLLDTPKEAEFDAVVAIARRLFGCAVATITLVDDHRQWFKANAGLEGSGCPRRDSICATAMYEPDLLVVSNLAADPRFADNPIVAGGPRMRFYAGVPLRPSDPSLPGIGTLCVMDTNSREFGDDDADLLRQLATSVNALIRARAAAAATLRLSAEVNQSADIIQHQNAQLRQAERMVGLGSWRYDLRDQSIIWSDHVFAIHGLRVGDVPPYDVAMACYPPDARLRLAELIDRAGDRGEAFEFESDFSDATGRARRVRSMGEPQVVNGAVIAVIGVFQDVTERYKYEQGLRETASTDPLTGLENRRAFERRLDDALRRARAQNEPLALLLLDLDNFKAVNDTLGHEAGDEVLRATAGRLREGHCAHAHVARLGGDEFVLLVTRPRDCARLEAFVEAVLGDMRQTIQRGGTAVPTSATIGAARFGPDVQDAADLLRRADLALYDAKRCQRGTAILHGVSGSISATPTSLKLVMR